MADTIEVFLEILLIFRAVIKSSNTAEKPDNHKLIEDALQKIKLLIGNKRIIEYWKMELEMMLLDL